jgi:hypothetical protein
MDDSYSRQRRVTLCGDQVAHPGHVCAFVNSEKEKYDIVIPFFHDAIAAGDALVNIMDESARAAHLGILAEAGIVVEEVQPRGRMQVLTTEETYLKGNDPDLGELLGFLKAGLEAARNNNHCLRTCGEMSWAERGRVPIEEVITYEARVNQLYPGYECTLLCVYDLARTPSSMIADIFATHPFAILNGRLRKNPYFVPPEEFLNLLAARRPGRTAAA